MYNQADRYYVAMVNFFSELKQERGASGVEYGIMIAAIAALIVVAAFSIGGNISQAFTDVDTEIQANMP